MAGKSWGETTRALLNRWLAAEEAAAASSAKPDKWYDGSEIESLSLEQILGEGVAEGRDKVFIIALNDFSAAVGDKWDRLKSKVDLITDDAARRHLERDCLYRNVGDGTYLVTLQLGGGADGLAKVVAMAEDLGHRLVGDRFVSLADAGITVSMVDAPQLLDGNGRFDAEALPRLARDADRLLSPSDWAVPVVREPVGRLVPLDHQPEMITARISDDPSATASGRPEAVWSEQAKPEGGAASPLLTLIDPVGPANAPPEWRQAPPMAAKPDPEWAEQAKPEGGAASPRLTPIDSIGPAESPPEWRQAPPMAAKADPEWAEQAKPEGGTASPRLTPIDPAAPPKAPPEWSDIRPMAPKPAAPAPKPTERSARAGFGMIETRWRPCWAVGSGRVDSHLCLPVLRDGQRLRGGDDLLRRLDGNTGRLDYETVLAAVVGLSACGERPLGTVILPLTCRSLGATNDMARILPALAALRGLRGIGLLAVEVVDVPASLSTDALAGLLAPLRACVGSVLLRRTLVAPEWRSDGLGDVDGIGLDLTVHQDWERDPSHLALSLKRFRAQLGAIPAYVWGLASQREVTAALDAGFVLGNGTALMADVTSPG